MSELDEVRRLLIDEIKAKERRKVKMEQMSKRLHDLDGKVAKLETELSIAKECAALYYRTLTRIAFTVKADTHRMPRDKEEMALMSAINIMQHMAITTLEENCDVEPESTVG